MQSFSFRWLRINLGDLAEAGSFGIVRARDKCSADLCGIPTGDDTEPKRLFCVDVTRPEILHWMLSVRAFDLASNGG